MKSLKQVPLQRRQRKAAAVLVGVLLLCGGAAIYWLRQDPDPALATRPAGRPAIPVSVVTAKRQDVPIFLVGLGTVQASFTVGIHSQVDGKLQEVFFGEGQHVKKGDVLAKIDPRLFQAALDQAKAKRAQDQATLIGYEKDLVRFKALAQKDFGTQQSVYQQQAKVDTAKATISADDAAIETVQTQLDYTSIVAPSDGRMGVRLVDPGNIVHASDQGSIGVLVRTQPTYVLFTLPARTLDSVRDGQAKGALEVVAYDRDNLKILGAGKLETIDNQIDTTTATYKLKAIFANEDERLWPGQFVNARILVKTEQNVVTIPNSAVQRGPSGVFTWVVKPDNTVEPRPIKIATMTADTSILTSGVSDGERVVTDGQYKLQGNSLVNVTPPAATASVGDPS
ncbi:MAG: efflux RND transporter periplasmic adaptor subunit [Xanthobacteraceae bacterium]